MQCTCIILGPLWPAQLSSYFVHIISRQAGISGGGELFNMKRVLSFSKIFLSKDTHSKHKWARYDQKCILFLCKLPVILVTFL